jgi:hypothetical protein
MDELGDYLRAELDDAEERNHPHPQPHRTPTTPQCGRAQCNVLDRTAHALLPPPAAISSLQLHTHYMYVLYIHRNTLHILPTYCIHIPYTKYTSSFQTHSIYKLVLSHKLKSQNHFAPEKNLY